MHPSSLNCPNCGAPAPQNINVRQPFKCTACGSVLMLPSLSESESESGKFKATACPQCQTINSPFRKYCLRCGTKLVLDCPVCYHANQINTLICERCGVNTQEEIKRRETWVKQKKQHDEQRQQALAQANKDSQQGEIARLLADLDEPDRHALTIYLLCQHGKAAVPALSATLLNDNDPDARYGSARALGMIGDTAAIPTLLKALSDMEPAVRYCAIDALVLLGPKNEQVIQAIGNLSKDTNKWVYQRAAKALQELGKK